MPLGLLLARVKALDETVGTCVLSLQTLPHVCLFPLAMLWFGPTDGAILFVVMTSALTAIAIAVRDGVLNVPPAYLRAARTMGAAPIALYTDVLMPASLPAIITGAKLGWSFAWRSLMAGELLFVSMGLGHLMQAGSRARDMSQVVAVMLVIVAIGLLADRALFSTVERSVRERRGLRTA